MLERHFGRPPLRTWGQPWATPCSTSCRERADPQTHPRGTIRWRHRWPWRRQGTGRHRDYAIHKRGNAECPRCAVAMRLRHGFDAFVGGTKKRSRQTRRASSRDQSSRRRFRLNRIAEHKCLCTMFAANLQPSSPTLVRFASDAIGACDGASSPQQAQAHQDTVHDVYASSSHGACVDQQPPFSP